MTLELRQLHPLFAAEADGIDLAQLVDAATVDAIWQAIDQYAVVVFCDQRLDDTQLRDFAPASVRLRSAALRRPAASGGSSIRKSATFRISTRMATCATATTGGDSTA
jgi:alpha-ketoglutarate-dependent taurine dioxygenase